MISVFQISHLNFQPSICSPLTIHYSSLRKRLRFARLFCCLWQPFEAKSFIRSMLQSEYRSRDTESPKTEDGGRELMSVFQILHLNFQPTHHSSLITHHSPLLYFLSRKPTVYPVLLFSIISFWKFGLNLY